MISIAICDDEIEMINQITTIIDTYMKEKNYQYHIDEFISGEDILKKQNKLSDYDLIFLDVEMPGISGLEVASRIRERYAPKVALAYISAYIKYATEPYKVKALRYILKENKMLKRAIYECIDAYITESTYAEYRYHKKLKYEEKDFAVGNIVYIESRLHDLIFFVLENGEIKEYPATGRLDDEEKELKKFRFIRVHKSFLVNFSYIRDVSRMGAELKINKTINIAQPRYNEVRKEFLLYKGEM
ncbi:MAG: LytTR family DNA-binding domain-containing protein [Lachnospiraceae bacterium]|nr:LytTR family DNA-binding domain-containing protein [Lachnospiraceae bacterium]